MPSKTPIHTTPIRSYVGLSQQAIDKQAGETYLSMCAVQSSITIIQVIDNYISNSLDIVMSPDDSSSSRLDALLIVEGILEIYAELNPNSLNSEWYAGTIQEIINTIKKERIRLKELGVKSIPNIPKAHIYVARILGE
ncbi:hypothetical protein H7169_02510 [Candidatus Gracilibacteria bacterium]|nr:hypothetical protein [Candidatus Gracilibacteria bacterium]